MDFKSTWRGLVARRGSDGVFAAPPSEEKDVKNEAVEIQEVRARIGRVAEARKIHASAVAEKDASSEDLNKVRQEAAVVRSRIEEREREIALAGAEVPGEPFPEDAEITRLSRCERIVRERLRICECKVRDSQGEIDARIRELEDSWAAVGASVSKRLLSAFRESAAALKEAHLAYWSLGSYFSQGWAGAAWKMWDGNLAIGDPMSREVVLNPLFARIASKWPASVQTLQSEMESLRAEIDQAKAAVTK
jgi:hypothetical protein